MMKTSRGVIVTCLLTLVALNCVSAIEEINSIEDLKRIYSEKSLPMHSLTLLHWFANNVDIDNNGVVRLSFNTRTDYGSHYYGNREGLLPSAPQGYQFYTVGNVNRPPGNTCPVYNDFPQYVLNPQVLELRDTGRNRDRIVVSVQTQTSSAHTVNQVYLTQHFRQQDNRGSGYDPDHTFHISTNLLQQLRLFSFNNNRRSLQELRDQFDQNIPNNWLNEIINIRGRVQAPLGLLYLIVAPQWMNLFGLCSSNKRLARDLPVKTAGEWQNCEIQKTHVQVITGGNGKAKILWRNVPGNQLKDVAVALFRNQMDQGSSLAFKKIEKTAGSYDTSVSLNEGLQVRLHKVEGYWSPSLKEEICRGKEFQSPHAVPVTGYTQLQLFVRDSNACFRLYIKQDCGQWKSDFSNSWVGLYTSAAKAATQYSTWQWVIEFEQGLAYDEYDTFEYCTGTTVTPGLQARFMIKKNYEENARTPVWL